MTPQKEEMRFTIIIPSRNHNRFFVKLCPGFYHKYLVTIFTFVGLKYSVKTFFLIFLKIVPKQLSWEKLVHFIY